MNSVEPITPWSPARPEPLGDPERVVSIIRDTQPHAPRHRVSLRGPAPNARPAGVTSLTIPARSRARWSWWRLAERLLGTWPVSLRAAVLLAAGCLVAAGVVVAELGLLGVGVLGTAALASGLALCVGRRAG